VKLSPVILHHLLNVFVQLANKRGFKKNLVRRKLINLLYEPRWIDDECGAIDGMRVGKGNRSTPRRPAHSAISSST
jgi:hypothetical protein